MDFDEIRTVVQGNGQGALSAMEASEALRMYERNLATLQLITTSQAATIEQLRAELAESRSNGAQFRASMYAVEERCVELLAERDEDRARDRELRRDLERQLDTAEMIKGELLVALRDKDAALAKSRQETIAECAAVCDETLRDPDGTGVGDIRARAVRDRILALTSTERREAGEVSR